MSVFYYNLLHECSVLIFVYSKSSKFHSCNVLSIINVYTRSLCCDISTAFCMSDLYIHTSYVPIYKFHCFSLPIFLSAFFLPLHITLFTTCQKWLMSPCFVFRCTCIFCCLILLVVKFAFSQQQ